MINLFLNLNVTRTITGERNLSSAGEHKLRSQSKYFQLILFMETNKTTHISWQSPDCSHCPLIHVEYFLGEKII